MKQRNVAPLLRTELALVIIGLSLVAPRLVGWGPQAVAVEVPPESSQAAVGYAQHRLWFDFLESREALVGRKLPEPTLSEYRAYISRLGLRRRGDRCQLFVLSDLDRARMTDRITVRIADSHPPLKLDVLAYDEGKDHRVGRLEIRVNVDDQVSCFVEAAEVRRIWSFWPIRPQPLLP
jgi:hypothetical protein